MISSSSSSLCHAISTDIPDLLHLPFSIVHHFRQILKVTSLIVTEVMYVGSIWSSCFCSSMLRGPQVYVTYEFVSAVSCMSGSSNLDNFRGGWYVAVQLLLCRVLSPGLVQYCSQHSCVIAVKLFLHTFS